MDSVNATVGLANRRVRPKMDAATLVPLTALARNPVEIVVTDEAGDHSISAERGRNGKVWLTCQCAESVAEGWCKHRVDLLCGRYDAAVKLNADTRQAFAAIIEATPLQNAGRDADRTLKAFADTLAIFDARRPTPVVGRDLGKFTDLISDLAACAGELEDALATLRRLLERA